MKINKQKRNAGIQKKIYKHGFTLIELAIVLAVIGLILSSITGGKALVEQAKLRSTFATFNRAKVAETVFRTTYDSYPGDFSSATNFWSACTDSGSNYCNGNGDTLFGVPGTDNYESYRYWQHLSLAGLISDSIDPTYSSWGECRPGNTSIKIPIENTCFTVKNLFPTSDTRIYGAPTQLKHVYHFNNAIGSGVLSPLQAKSFDQKYDDGLADRGRIQAEGGSCVSGDWSSARTYLTTDTPYACVFWLYP